MCTLACALLNVLRLQTLFFVRLGADLVGRTIPRVKGAAMTSQVPHVPAAKAQFG